MVKILSAHAGIVGLILDPGRSPGDGNPLQYPGLGKSHGQRSLEVYSPWGHKGVRYDLVTKQQQQPQNAKWTK